ncbi:conserved hypothetical protein [Thermotomaculum hydrothermale]|uniref:Tetratricopeptide repeat protein n=1 Tax=Thermotomaculum hydrothermale TaxID=981385 RepID=A0A7R6SYF4_9BACT|nr:tetratricopeptide repeat protein [Thermotomaculum hydrothermale]BBB32590.1 conserved hypothetical protein [Thermotomaculum hydrothermale]
MKKIFIITLSFLLLSGYSFAENNNKNINKSLKEFTEGVLLSARGDCEKAISHFEKALEYNKDIYIYFELADCYKSLSEMEKTIEYLELATKEFPDNPEGYLRLGDYYSDLVNVLKSGEIVKKALENYRKAFELSKDYEIYYKIIEAEFLLQDYDSIIKDYENLPESFRNDFYTLFYVSVAYNTKNKKFELFKTLKKLSRLNINNPRILNELITLSFQNGFYLFSYKFSLNLKAIYRDYNDWDRLLLSALMSAKYNDVVKIFDKNLKKSPTPVSLYCLATAYAYLHQYKNAKENYQKILKSKDIKLPGSLSQDVYLDYIRLLIAMKEYKSAYKETLNYEKIYGLSPDDILKERFEALLLDGNIKEAKKALYILKMVAKDKDFVQKVEEIFNKNPKLLGYDYLSALYYSFRDYKTSAKYYLKCAKMTKDNKLYLEGLALCYHNLGEINKALKIYKKLYERYPEDAGVLNNYAYFLVEFDIDIKKSLELAEKAVEKQPEMPSYRDTLGYAYLKNGNIEKAEENLLFAYKKAPLNPEICLHMGDLYFKKGDFDKAKEYWLDAIDFGISNVKEVKDRLNLINSD